jgi:hypothetical protein
MNCQECQKKILDALAAGESYIAPEVASHQNACATCATFYRAQQNLYQRVDAGLQSLMNQHVPPSLLPRVRARLDEVPGARIGWRPAWSVTAVAAAAILALVVAYALRRPHTAVNSAQIAAASPQQRPAPQVVPVSQKPQPEAAHVSPVAKRTRTAGIAPAIATPKVIVSTEERQAFAKFIAEVPEDTAVAAALAQPVPVADEDAVEIALLKIEPLQVKPLEVNVGE